MPCNARNIGDMVGGVCDWWEGSNCNGISCSRWCDDVRGMVAFEVQSELNGHAKNFLNDVNYCVITSDFGGVFSARSTSFSTPFSRRMVSALFKFPASRTRARAASNRLAGTLS